MKLHRLAAIALILTQAAFGNGETTSSNMNLTIPAVGITTGPDWATDINTSLGLIDAHDHSSGKGVQIGPAGINISSDLACNSHNFTGLRSVRLQPYASSGAFGATASDVGALLEITPDLYYRDANGNLIRLTISGGPNAGVGNISGLPSTPSGGAGIAWQNAQGTFQFTLDAGTAGGNADVGTLILRYAGSYPTPSGNYVALQAPSSLATGYAFTVPATTPAAAGAFLTSGTSGTLSYTNTDNSSLEISSSTIRVKASGVTGAMLNSNTVDNSTLQYTSSQLSIKDLGVTAAKIANATITGTQVSSSINLPGNAAQENARNLVVSGTNAATSLAIVRGILDSAGNPAAGEGFTTARTGTGAYTVGISNTMASVPAVTATLSGSTAGASIYIGSVSTSGFTVVVLDIAGAPVDSAFHFHAIGPR